MLSAAILLLLGASGAVTVVALLRVQRRRQQAPGARCEAARTTPLPEVATQLCAADAPHKTRAVRRST